jgi:hypothetical protein
MRGTINEAHYPTLSAHLHVIAGMCNHDILPSFHASARTAHCIYLIHAEARCRDICSATSHAY